MPIPEIFHFTWKNNELTELMKESISSFRKNHPKGIFKFYTDKDCRNLVKSVYPHLIKLYDDLMPIQRIDLFRYLAVYYYGGIYFDLDVICRESLCDLILDKTCIVAEELTETSEEMKQTGDTYPLRIANYMFAAEKNHPFIRRLIDETVARTTYKKVDSKDWQQKVLNTTGPGMVSDVYNTLSKEEKPYLLVRPKMDHNYFGKYAVHMHVGSWRVNQGGGGTKMPIVPIMLLACLGIMIFKTRG